MQFTPFYSKMPPNDLAGSYINEMKWYKKTLRKNKKEIIASATIFTIFITVTLLWGYFSGERFAWTKIEPISYPSILNWRFYSALAFVTLGSFLFSRGFWLFIYQISSSRSSYRENKKEVWTLVTLTTFGLAVIAVWIINSILSILFNIIMVFIFPAFFITIVLTLVSQILIKRFIGV